MKYEIILAGAVLTCGVFLPGIATQAAAAPQGAILVADDDHNMNNMNMGGHDQHPPPGGPGHPAHPQTHMGGNPNPPGGHNMMGGHNPMQGHGVPSRNFDRHSYQRNFTATRHFHVGAYARPHGWYARHWTYGEILPALFWVQDYWLNNYLDYGLAAPPPGFVWVRDGDDALLVDTSTGEILQVEYGVFD